MIFMLFLILYDLASGFLYDHVDGASPAGWDRRSIIYRAELREVSGSLMTLVLLLCLCGGITGLQSDYDRRHFITRGASYLTVLFCACENDSTALMLQRPIMHPNFLSVSVC